MYTIDGDVFYRSTFYLFYDRAPRNYSVHTLDSRVVHCKKVNDFPVPSRDVTNQTLPGIIILFPARESLVSYIPAGDGEMTITFFLQCNRIDMAHPLPSDLGEDSWAG